MSRTKNHDRCPRGHCNCHYIRRKGRKNNVNYCILKFGYLIFKKTNISELIMYEN